MAYLGVIKNEAGEPHGSHYLIVGVYKFGRKCLRLTYH
jgi:hypothetical protein